MSWVEETSGWAFICPHCRWVEQDAFEVADSYRDHWQPRKCGSCNAIYMAMTELVITYRARTCDNDECPNCGERKDALELVDNGGLCLICSGQTLKTQ